MTFVQMIISRFAQFSRLHVLNEEPFESKDLRTRVVVQSKLRLQKSNGNHSRVMTNLGQIKLNNNYET